MTRLGKASNALPSTCPRPTNIKAMRTKKTATIKSIGTVNCATSGLRYSVPKKISCGDAWWPTSMARPLQ